MTRLLYRTAAVLIVLFALGHTSGYPWSDPQWGVDLHAVQATRFDVLGSSRTYWDFYVGFGLIISVFQLLAAWMAWQLAGLPPQARALMRGTSWALTLSFAAMTVLNAMYFFAIPIAMSAAVTVCLAAATLRAQRDVAGP